MNRANAESSSIRKYYLVKILYTEREVFAMNTLASIHSIQVPLMRCRVFTNSMKSASHFGNNINGEKCCSPIQHGIWEKRMRAKILLLSRSRWVGHFPSHAIGASPAHRARSCKSRSHPFPTYSNPRPQHPPIVSSTMSDACGDRQIVRRVGRVLSGLLLLKANFLDRVSQLAFFAERGLAPLSDP